MLCVVIAFSEHHMESLVSGLKLIPHVGKFIHAPLKEFLRAQKLRLHRRPEDPIPEQVDRDNSSFIFERNVNGSSPQGNKFSANGNERRCIGDDRCISSKSGQFACPALS